MTQTSEFIDFYCKKIGLEYNGKSLGRMMEDGISGTLSLNVGVININSEEIDVTCNIRYPISVNLSEVYNPIYNEMKPLGLEIIEESHKKPLHISKNSELINKLMKAYSI